MRCRKSLHQNVNPPQQTGFPVTPVLLDPGISSWQALAWRGWLLRAAIFTCFWNPSLRINTREVCFSQCSCFFQFPTVNICVRTHFLFCTNGKSCSMGIMQSRGRQGKGKKKIPLSSAFSLRVAPTPGNGCRVVGKRSEVSYASLQRDFVILWKQLIFEPLPSFLLNN